MGLNDIQDCTQEPGRIVKTQNLLNRMRDEKRWDVYYWFITRLGKYNRHIQIDLEFTEMGGARHAIYFERLDPALHLQRFDDI